jgi:flagellar basal-body rod protein FlgC
VTEFGALSAAAAGMDAQRAALNVAARNVAAAETGENFARLVPHYAVDDGSGDPERGLEALSARFEGGAVDQAGDADDLVRFTGTTQDAGNAPDSIAEMVTVLNAERAYEANVSVFEAGKRLAERTIDVGRA